MVDILQDGGSRIMGLVASILGGSASGGVIADIHPSLPRTTGDATLEDGTMRVEAGNLLHCMSYFAQSATLAPVDMEHPDEDLI